MRKPPFPIGVGVVLSTCLFGFTKCSAAGVTVITHGYSGDVEGWVTGMANDLPAYYSFPGTNFTTYKITLTTDGSSYYYQWSRTAGGSPSSTDSEEIIVKLDWSQMAGGTADYDESTYDVAWVATYVLLQTNTISDLGGHALAEFPIHLIGHSRGGSLVCELSRDLGTNGVWVDHLTSLDPHPLNNDGNFDPFLPTDATAASTYANVLFRDNYWQDFAGGFLDFNGEPVSGAYNRHLTSLSGGYNNTSVVAPYHSNVHLWYHGTIEWSQPVSNSPASDTEASIGSAERQSWWSAYEYYGAIAGFYYSLIGGGDRLSTDQPVGQGMIRDGYNQWWDLGAGTSGNRTALTTNNGNWPNLIKVNRTATNQVLQGQSTPLKIYYQWAKPITTNATISIYLDNDLNPLNTNQTLLRQITVPGNGAANVSYLTTNITLSASNASPGFHAFLAKISGGGRTRYLYAPELVEVVSSRQPPTLDIAKLGPSQYGIGVNGLPGQTVVLQNSTDLQTWLPLITNTLVTSRWIYTNAPPTSSSRGFYRAIVP